MNFDIELFKRVSIFLSDCPDIITESQVESVYKEGVSKDLAYLYLLKEYLRYDFDYSKIVIKENIEDYINDPYYKNIKINNVNYNGWTLKYSKIKPYELIVHDDLLLIDNNVYPNLSYFDKPFKYISVFQNNREWMTITPNEINTMKLGIERANGSVLVAGLGLGYFAYMISLKDNVDNITIVELDNNVIKLFKEVILKQFEFKLKITIINKNIYDYINEVDINKYDYTYIDIYHDVSDGLEVYKRIRQNSKLDQNKIDFWIENTMKYYL